MNFIDTADVYGMGRSERLIAQLKRERKEEIVVATKAGRRLSPHTADGYNEKNLAAFIEDSLRNLATDCLDLVQLHCPPTDVYYTPEVFGALDRLVEAGKIRYYGVSVERVEEALKAIEFPQRPDACRSSSTVSATGPRTCSSSKPGRSRLGFWRASRWRAACSPASSRAIRSSPPTITATSTATARRSTWAKPSPAWITRPRWRPSKRSGDWLPPGVSMAQFALRWILMFDAVTCAIPGAKRPSQVADNCAASDLPPLSDRAMASHPRHLRREDPRGRASAVVA